MSKANMNDVLIEISETGPHIFIDGQELRNVYSFKLERTAMQSCELTVQFDSEKAKVVFADGWKGKKIAVIVGAASGKKTMGQR